MGLEQYVENSWLIPLLPLIGAVIAGFWGARRLRGQSHWPIWLGVGAAALYSVGLLIAVVHDAHIHTGTIGHAVTWFQWIDVGNLKVGAAAWIDPLSAMMLVVVTGVGFFITIFAAGYMKGETGYFRFFAFLGLFIFMMTCLVMGNNFIMLYLGWEGVGLCSYLLIGYYYDRPAAAAAAKKAFLVNRVGDFGFGIGIMLIYFAFGTVNYFDVPGGPRGVLDIVAGALTGNVPAGLTAFQRQALDWIPFCLLLGAVGKSAQFPLYVWLPDAMEGPTPVSALIHAATMVTAGVYMVARCGVLFAATPASLVTVAVIGAVTALLAATIALRQFDLKKVFAYSTVSQLGFMFVGVGVLAPVAGAFHLVTHAFFKALLFLASGVVMHAMMGELDMRKMSGLKRVLPKTRILMLIGCAALAGFPFLSGFYSKDQIIAAAWEHSKVLAGVMLFTAFLTAYYTFRLYFRVFEGPTVVPPPPDDASPGIIIGGAAAAHATASASAVQTGDTKHSGVDEHLQTGAHQAATAHGHGGDHGHHDHEPGIMIMPLVVLAAGSVIVGFLLANGDLLGRFLGRSPSLQQTYQVAVRAAEASASPTPVARGEVPEASPKPAEVNPAPLGQFEVRRDPELLEHEHSTHLLMAIASGLIALAGIGLAYVLHLKNRRAAERLAEAVPGVARAIENKYWVDELYAALFVEPLKALGSFLYAIDRLVVDGVVWLVGFVPQFSGFVLKLTTQRGFLQGYAAAMVFGIVVILLLVLL